MVVIRQAAIRLSLLSMTDSGSPNSSGERPVRSAQGLTDGPTGSRSAAAVETTRGTNQGVGENTASESGGADEVSVVNKIGFVDDVEVMDDLTIIDDPDVRVGDGLHRTRLFGLDLINSEHLEPVIDQILDGPRSSGEWHPVVLTPNVDIVVHLEQNQSAPEYELFHRAQYCLPDGQPLVMVSGLLGEKIKARLPGSELFQGLWPRIAEQERPVVVIASTDEVAALLEKQHPKAGYIVPPMFDEDDEDAIADIVTDTLAAAMAVRPELVLVGIGNPKDARIIAGLLDRWDPQVGPAPLCLGLGGSFNMHLGLRKRAPSWIQRMGFEWFFRFLQEPRRLFYRYFIRDMAFFPIVWREWRANRKGR